MKRTTNTATLIDDGIIDDRRKTEGDSEANKIAALIESGAMEDRRKADRDRRRSPRIRTLKGAKIAFSNGVPINCVVRNISETGAQLEVHDPVLQNTFDLVFDLDHSRRSCRVMWRKEPRMGVKFE